MNEGIKFVFDKKWHYQDSWKQCQLIDVIVIKNIIIKGRGESERER